MSYYGIYSPTLGWNVFGPLSAFLWIPTMFSGGLGGPQGPYEWFYLSSTPDTSGVVGVVTGMGLPGAPGNSYVGSYFIMRFNITQQSFVNYPYFVIFSPYSGTLPALALPFSFGLIKGASLYMVFYLQNTPLN